MLVVLTFLENFILSNDRFAKIAINDVLSQVHLLGVDNDRSKTCCF